MGSSSRLRFWVEHFLGSRGELRGTDAYTKTTDESESPRGREDVAIVSGRVGAYHRDHYDMGRASLLLWYVLQNDRPDTVCRRPKVRHLLFLGPSTAFD